MAQTTEPDNSKRFVIAVSLSDHKRNPVDSFPAKKKDLAFQKYDAHLRWRQDAPYYHKIELLEYDVATKTMTEVNSVERNVGVETPILEVTKA